MTATETLAPVASTRLLSCWKGGKWLFWRGYLARRGDGTLGIYSVKWERREIDGPRENIVYSKTRWLGVDESVGRRDLRRLERCKLDTSLYEVVGV